MLQIRVIHAFLVLLVSLNTCYQAKDENVIRIKRRKDTLNDDIKSNRSFGKTQYVLNTEYVEDSLILINNNSWFKPPDRNTSVRNFRRSSDSEDGFTTEEELELLFLHNQYRAKVTPSAGDMSFMEWDDQLSIIAQHWANKCKFMHGMPRSAATYADTIGQNLYKGYDKTGIRALKLWFEEYEFYNFHERTCMPDKMCGHYTQMAWAQSKYLGCGIKVCKKFLLIVCNYSPAGNEVGLSPYIVGKACSQCKPKDGGFCSNKLCVTMEQCDRNSAFCDAKCPLHCHNCGVLDDKSCKCRCKSGWDSLDCSKPCRNEHESCEKSPGWHTETSCFMHHNRVGDKLCRKMCKQCHEREESERSVESCCAGTMCLDGHVLDLERRLCNCRLLCPGPSCDAEMSGIGRLEATLQLLGTFICLWFYLFL